MSNNRRMLSLLMAVLGSVSSSFAAQRRPNGGAQSGATQGRRMNARRPGGMKSNGNSRGGRTSGHKEMVKKPVVLSDNGNVSLPKGKNGDGGKWSNVEKAGIGAGGVVGAGLLTTGIVVAGRAYHYSDGQIRKRNLAKSSKMSNDNDMNETSFDKLLAYEMKCDTSGKASLKTRPFVWLKVKSGQDNNFGEVGKWYVLMRKDNKTVKGSLKGLCNLFLKKQGAGGNTLNMISPEPELAAKVKNGEVSRSVIRSTAYVVSVKSVGADLNSINVSGGDKQRKKGEKVMQRIEKELGQQSAMIDKKQLEIYMIKDGNSSNII